MDFLQVSMAWSTYARGISKKERKKYVCFLDDILIVSKGTDSEHKKLVTDVLEKMARENHIPQFVEVWIVFKWGELART